MRPTAHMPSLELGPSITRWIAVPRPCGDVPKGSPKAQS